MIVRGAVVCEQLAEAKSELKQLVEAHDKLEAVKQDRKRRREEEKAAGGKGQKVAKGKGKADENAQKEHKGEDSEAADDNGDAVKDGQPSGAVEAEGGAGEAQGGAEEDLAQV